MNWKILSLTLGLTLIFPHAGFAKRTPIDPCVSAAHQAIAPWFKDYTEERRQSMISDLEPGDELNEDDLPGGLALVERQDGIFSFGWGELQECACGVEVKTKKSVDGKTCDAKVDDRSQSCDCG